MHLSEVSEELSCDSALTNLLALTQCTWYVVVDQILPQRNCFPPLTTADNVSHATLWTGHWIDNFKDGFDIIPLARFFFKLHSYKTNATHKAGRD